MHLNLRQRYLPYKHIIAEILMDKNHGIRTVINKIEDVGSDSVFRTFPFELLAGENEVLGALGGPAILIATKGSAEMTVGGENFDLKEGYIYFVAPKQDIKLSAGTEGLLMRKSAHPGKL